MMECAGALQVPSTSYAIAPTVRGKDELCESDSDESRDPLHKCSPESLLGWEECDGAGFRRVTVLGADERDVDRERGGARCLFTPIVDKLGGAGAVE